MDVATVLVHHTDTWYVERKGQRRHKGKPAAEPESLGNYPLYLVRLRPGLILVIIVRLVGASLGAHWVVRLKANLQWY